jgi:hypothetical protein
MVSSVAGYSPVMAPPINHKAFSLCTLFFHILKNIAEKYGAQVAKNLKALVDKFAIHSTVYVKSIHHPLSI